MKLWIDDWRRAPNETWIHAWSVGEAIAYLMMFKFDLVEFDYNLGWETGDKIARYIENEAIEGRMDRILWRIHSADVRGSRTIARIMRRADMVWDYWEVTGHASRTSRWVRALRHPNR